jgi:hypothetical protein
VIDTDTTASPPSADRTFSPSAEFAANANLPKPRSGKIMRRLLRDIAENRDTGDVTALQDAAVMTLISSGLSDTKSND